MSNSAILLSIRPEFAEKIFQGTKTVELRRIRPKQLRKGTLVLMYVSSPTKSLAGAFTVDEVIEQSIEKLWEMVRHKAGVTRQQFDLYYKGTSSGIGIFIKDMWKLPSPIELQELQKGTIPFHPPQSFRYATANEVNKVSNQLPELTTNLEISVQDYFHDL